MALLSHDMIRHIRGVTDAYSARERERLGVSSSEPRRVEPTQSRPRQSSSDDAR